MNYHYFWLLFKWKQVNTGNSRIPWDTCSGTQWPWQSQSSGNGGTYQLTQGALVQLLLGIPLPSGWLLAVTVQSVSLWDVFPGVVSFETLRLPHAFFTGADVYACKALTGKLTGALWLEWLLNKCSGSTTLLTFAPLVCSILGRGLCILLLLSSKRYMCDMCDGIKVITG